MMGKLGNIGKVTLRVFGNDHLPPHFHVKGGVEALVSIAPLAVIGGSLPASLRVEVFAWAEANKDRLAAEWNAWNPHCPFA